jgi:hypothetical protein
MKELIVQTHDDPFEISGDYLLDFIIGAALAWPLGLPNLIAYDQTHCIVPIMNSIQSVINAVYFYVYFAQHSMD